MGGTRRSRHRRATSRTGLAHHRGEFTVELANGKTATLQFTPGMVWLKTTVTAAFRKFGRSIAFYTPSAAVYSGHRRA